jgi:hypothetical protein
MSDAERRRPTILIPAEAAPPCSCGAAKVSVFLDAIEKLIDNMGCDLGLSSSRALFAPTATRMPSRARGGRSHLQ